MKALFAGSFDPFTTGHMSIVERALQMFDKVAVAIGVNEHKNGEWSTDVRLNTIKEIFANEPRVETYLYSGATALFAKEVGADTLLRGVRSALDFEYERNLADVNRAINGIETIFLPSDPALSFVSSSMVREMIHLGLDASKYIAGTKSSDIK